MKNNSNSKFLPLVAGYNKLALTFLSIPIKNTLKKKRKAK
jgi:hypothetical protein